MRLGRWIGLLSLLVLLLSACGDDRSAEKDGPVAINGEPVSTAEFMLYFFEAQEYFAYIGGEEIWDTDFDGQSAEEVAKERAMNTVKTVKLTAAHAEDFGVSLTEDDKKAALDQAQTLYDSLSEAERAYIGLSLEEITAIMEENVLYESTYGAIAAGYTLDEADFEAFYENNADLYRQTSTMVILSTILVADEVTADMLFDRIMAGEDMAALSEAYEIEEEAKGDIGHMEAYVGQLQEDFGWDLTDVLPGQVLRPVAAPEGYYVIRVDEVIGPDEEEVRAYAESYYTTSMQTQLFDQAFRKWEEAAEVTKNEALWNAIHIMEQE